MRSLFQQPRRCASVFFPDMGIFLTDVNFKYKGLVDSERPLTPVLVFFFACSLPLPTMEDCLVCVTAYKDPLPGD
jgi:hypothetical protein